MRCCKVPLRIRSQMNASKHHKAVLPPQFEDIQFTDWQSLEWSALLLLIGCLVFIAGSSLWGRECLHIKWSAVHCSIGQRLVYSVSMATLSPNKIFQLACAKYFWLLNAHCTKCKITLANLIWLHITSLQIGLMDESSDQILLSFFLAMCMYEFVVCFCFCKLSMSVLSHWFMGERVL